MQNRGRSMGGRKNANKHFIITSVGGLTALGQVCVGAVRATLRMLFNPAGCY